MSAIGQLGEVEKREMREKLLQQRMYKQNRHAMRAVNANISSEGLKQRMSSDTFGSENDSRNCSFLVKTGACINGEGCPKFHPWPEKSRTLVFQNMYNGPGLVSIRSAFNDDDIEENFDEGENEIYAAFIDFWDDVVPELEKFGPIEELRVCRNNAPHLRGNMLVMFKDEESAVKAQTAMNGRFYAEKPISCSFCLVTNFKSASCASFNRGGCERGWDCNFLHVFINPGRKYYSWGPIDRSGRFGKPRPWDKDNRPFHSRRSRRSPPHRRRSHSPRGYRSRSLSRRGDRRDHRRRDDDRRRDRSRDGDRRRDRSRDRRDRDRDRDRPRRESRDDRKSRDRSRDDRRSRDSHRDDRSSRDRDRDERERDSSRKESQNREDRRNVKERSRSRSSEKKTKEEDAPAYDPLAPLPDVPSSPSAKRARSEDGEKEGAATEPSPKKARMD